MKLLIIEGPDRCGKDTLISGLCKQASNSIVRHFGSVKGNTDLEKRDYQFQFFKKEFQLASERNKFEMPDRERYPRDIYIWNRSHLGEFVYGTLYRKTNPQNWVYEIEKMFGFHVDVSVYLVLLTADPKFLCAKDDGLSFTAEHEKKKIELDLFKQAYTYSNIINKKTIKVGNDISLDYLDKDIILDTVNKFLF